MKKILVLVCAAILAFGQASAQSAEDYSSKKFAIGDIAADLEGNTPDGKTMRLGDLATGRYILLDFWASWCYPCRASNPKLVRAYKELKNASFKNAPKGFTIFSVSLDMEQDAWQKAIKKDELSWEGHISDLRGWDSKLAEIYGVEVIPQVFLIGPDGKVLFKSLSTEAAIEELKKYRD